MQKSNQYFEESKQFMPGGVNSPVRACKSVSMNPLFIEKAEGAYVFDVDGNKYIDYVGSWGPMILGHSHPKVISAIKDALDKGTSFGAPTQFESKIAKTIIDNVKSVDMIRMVNSGTEACMSAIRLARAYTNRKKIIKFDGCYHGHSDSLLVDAGSGVATFNIPGSPGIPEEITKDTLSIPYNNSELLLKVFEQYPDEIACVIVEPVAGNMGMVAPSLEFLKDLRKLTKDFNSVLIFDEVMTGFRLSFGGAQELYDIDPDLSCFGKIIGGGLPVGAYGGKKKIMDMIAPSGPVYQAGTLSGNPLSVASGLATLKILLENKDIYKELEEKTSYLVEAFNHLIKKYKVKAQAKNVASMFGVFFTDETIENFDDAKKSNLESFRKYYKFMREEKIYLAPSQFEAGFMSLAHSYDDLDKTILAFDKFLNQIDIS